VIDDDDVGDVPRADASNADAMAVVDVALEMRDDAVAALGFDAVRAEAPRLLALWVLVLLALSDSIGGLDGDMDADGSERMLLPPRSRMRRLVKQATLEGHSLKLHDRNSRRVRRPRYLICRSNQSAPEAAR